MTKDTANSKVLLFVEPGPAEKLVKNSFKKQEGFQLVDSINQLDKWYRVVRDKNPNLILLDYRLGEKQKEHIHEEISVRFPDISLVVLLPDEDASRAQKVMLEGATAFITQPFNKKKLISTLQSVRALQKRKLVSSSLNLEKPENFGQFHTYAFFAPSGGVGCSTLAVNTALSLVEKADGDVLLLDGKQYFGNIDIMLNLQVQSTMGDLISYADRLTDELIREVVTVHSSGLHVLPSPKNLRISQSITPDSLYSIVQSLQKIYDHIVIDVGSALSENAVTLMDSAFRVLLVIDPGMAALHGVRIFLEISSTLEYSERKVLLAINRANAKGGISVQQIEKLLGKKPFASIPDDYQLAFRSINLGVPININNPKSSLSKSIGNLATSLMELSENELRAQSLEQGASSDQQDARS